MSPGPGARVQLLAVPALLVHVVHAEQLNPSALQVLAQHAGTVHRAVCPLGVAAEGRGKHEDPRAGVTPHLERHVPAERRAVPAVVFAVQGAACSRKGRALRKRRPQADS